MEQLQIVPWRICNQTALHPPRGVNQGYNVHKVSLTFATCCYYCAAGKVCNLLLGKTNLGRVNQLSHPTGLMKCSRSLKYDFIFSFFTIKKDKALQFLIIICTKRRI